PEMGRRPAARHRSPLPRDRRTHRRFHRHRHPYQPVAPARSRGLPAGARAGPNHRPERRRMTSTLRIAVPNKGRLKSPSVELLRAAGLSFEVGERALSVRVDNADIDLLFVRTEDVPELVADEVADLGITGVDLLAEYGGDLNVLLELGYGKCRLA